MINVNNLFHVKNAFVYTEQQKVNKAQNERPDGWKCKPSGLCSFPVLGSKSGNFGNLALTQKTLLKTLRFLFLLCFSKKILGKFRKIYTSISFVACRLSLQQKEANLLSAKADCTDTTTLGRGIKWTHFLGYDVLFPWWTRHWLDFERHCHEVLSSHERNDDIHPGKDCRNQSWKYWIITRLMWEISDLRPYSHGAQLIFESSKIQNQSGAKSSQS